VGEFDLQGMIDDRNFENIDAIIHNNENFATSLKEDA
jgi:hypothetical protein